MWGFLGALTLVSATSSLACQPAAEEPAPLRGPAPVVPDTAAPPLLPLAAPELADLVQLTEVVGVVPDTVEVELVEVDRAVERDLPVRAAGILTDRVLPASRALRARLRAMDPRSALGTELHQQWVSACAAREDALTAYAVVLERGIVEDLALADALRDQRRAEDALAAARDALAAARRRIDASAEGE